MCVCVCVCMYIYIYIHTYIYLWSLSSLTIHIEYDVHYKSSDFHSGGSNYGCLLGFETG